MNWSRAGGTICFALMACASWSLAQTTGRPLTSTVLSEIDTSYVEQDLPAITGQPLPPLPPDRGKGRVAPTIWAMSDDGLTLAWILSLPAGPQTLPRETWLIVNRKAGPKVDEIRQTTIRISPDGKRVAYEALLKHPGAPEPRWSVVCDGVVGPPYRNVIPGSIAFSADSKHVAYVAAREDGALCVVRDGREGKPLPPLAQTRVMEFSPDLQHFTYGGAGPQESGVWLDGRKIAGDDPPIGPWEAVFSPDSRRLALRVTAPSDPPGPAQGFRVLLDGKLGPWHPEVLKGSLRFSDDSARFVYVAGDENDNFFMVEDGKPGQAYNFILPESVRFGGKSLGFVAGTGPRDKGHVGSASHGKMIPMGLPTLIVNGNPLPGMGGTPVFSADGRRVAYFGNPQQPPPKPFFPSCVIVDGKPDPPLQEIMHLQFSPDGNHYAYVGADNPGDPQRVLVINGVAHRPFGDGYCHRLRIDNAGAVTAVVGLSGVYRRIVFK